VEQGYQSGSRDMRKSWEAIRGLQTVGIHLDSLNQLTDFSNYWSTTNLNEEILHRDAGRCLLGSMINSDKSSGIERVDLPKENFHRQGANWESPHIPLAF
jgi:hypothetical protein